MRQRNSIRPSETHSTYLHTIASVALTAVATANCGLLLSIKTTR